ncbi:MAG: response regulator [Paenibacillaceae bacterium]
MKLLIVDDERHVREAIKLLVNWFNLGFSDVLEAENGAAAMELVKQHHPEIILTDMMMPIKSGVDLLAWMHNFSPNSKKIAISGHNDFDLVRKTLIYGGMDYILKPVDPVQLNEALLKAKQDWEEEDNARKKNVEQNIEMNQLKPIYWDKFFSNLITDPQYFRSIHDVLHSGFGLSKNTKECQIAILNIDSMERKVMDKFNNHWDLLFFSLTNICNEFLQKGNFGFACRYWNSEHEILIFYWKSFGGLQRMLTQINEGFYTTLGSRFDFGVGLPHNFSDNLLLSYNEAKSALRHRNMLHKKTSWLHVYEEKEVPHLSTLHLSTFGEKLRLALLSGNEVKIDTAINEWIAAVIEIDSITIEQMELWRHEFDVLYAQWSKPLLDDVDHDIRDAMPERQLPITLDEFGCLSLSHWRQELTQRIVRLSAALIKHQQKDKNVIHEIVIYLEQNYHKEVTLQDIAKHFYLSREHISRKFKQELGVNLSDYIVRIRIEKAKLLLLNRNMKIALIAEMVGYADEKYFSKVFRKFENLSPNQYRKKATLSAT